MQKIDHCKMDVAHLTTPISVQMESHTLKKALGRERLSGMWVQALKSSAQPTQGKAR